MTKRIFLIVLSLIVALFISACGVIGGGGDPSFKLTVTVTGDGVVTSANGDINCGSDCDQTYTESTEVRLTATPNSGETFNGWGGACSGSGECTVTVDSAKTVTAEFSGGGTTPNPGGPFLFQAFVEAGEGTIASADGNINCTSDPDGDAANCAEEYPDGTTVVVTATAADGFVFDRFDGSSCSVDASEANVCTYTMSKDRDARIVFRPEGADVFPVVADSDDAEEYTTANPELSLEVGQVSLDSSDLELNYDEGGEINQIVGIRFEEVSAAVGKTIKEAFIQFTPGKPDATVPTLTITAQVSADPPTFSATTNNISSRLKTTASVTWTPAAWQNGSVTEATRTPDLYALMQEAGWTSGGSVVFIITGDGTDAQRNAISAKNGSARAPKLFIDYEETED